MKGVYHPFLVGPDQLPANADPYSLFAVRKPIPMSLVNDAVTPQFESLNMPDTYIPGWVEQGRETITPEFESLKDHKKLSFNEIVGLMGIASPLLQEQQMQQPQIPRPHRLPYQRSALAEIMRGIYWPPDRQRR